MPRLNPEDPIWRVAVRSPVRGLFDYLAPAMETRPAAGLRVRVPFGRASRIGILMETAPRPAVEAARLKRIDQVIDREPVLPDELLRLLRWAADYYHHPLGEVVLGALPGGLRKDTKRRAGPWPGEAAPDAGAAERPALNPAQRQAAEAILSGRRGFEVFLLDGVTGSGKTEVYFSVIEALLREDRQVLLLVPEIGLTPQILGRIRRRFACTLAVIHSGLTERERGDAWLLAASGAAAIVVGTRSAVFTPLPRLGAIIVDEEHDGSYKQQTGFRYHARDLAVVRARHGDVPVVLGSATPALESLCNAEQGRYRPLLLPARAGNALEPAIRLIDLRRERPEHGLSATLAGAIEAHLADGNQTLLFLNRRGYAPTLLCEACGWLASCRRCDAHLILHLGQRSLRCHHCDSRSAMPEACPQCGGTDLRPLGQGTERLEETLSRRFADAEVIRIDRDSARRRGALEALMHRAQQGGRQILLGTQMLAKGHHLPDVTLVGILDADGGLFGPDFRSGERMGQLITQVAGRAGRADKPGEVLIQTRHPEHPLLAALLGQGYRHFARALLEERRLAGMPPYRGMALIRAEAVSRTAPIEFLAALRGRADALAENGVELLGPAPAAMERRAGRYRAQLLLLAAQRPRLHALLTRLLPEIDRLPLGRKVRCSVDVDPIDEL
jgi:primosomal protein N' (replication factor Y)